MAGTLVFNSQKDLINYISNYFTSHRDTIAIVSRELRKNLVSTLLVGEDFDKFKDTSNTEQNVLFIIKTGHKEDRTLTLKVCDAYNATSNYLKMIDIENILIVDGLISSDEENSINYYNELCSLKLATV